MAVPVLSLQEEDSQPGETLFEGCQGNQNTFFLLFLIGENAVFSLGCGHGLIVLKAAELLQNCETFPGSLCSIVTEVTIPRLRWKHSII